MQITTKLRAMLMVLPLLLLLHEVEEYWTALPWLRRHSADIPTFLSDRLPESASFVLIAGVVFFAVYAFVSLMVIKKPDVRTWSMILAILLLARLENGVLHLAQAVWFRGYTPGVLTAVFLVIPLCVVVLENLVREGMVKKKSIVWMIPAGLVVQTAAIAIFAWPALK